MRPIHIKVVPHKEQRYETAGDYFENKEGLQIRVSKLKDPRHQFLIALHELVEAKLCENKGIRIAAIDAFDFTFEDTRQPGNTDEPGDDPSCPYWRQHQVASMIERVVAGELGVDWAEYEQAVLALDQRPVGRGRT